MKKWFAYDGESGCMDFFDSKEEARELADLFLYEDSDHGKEGWRDRVEKICWGRVVQSAQETKPKTAEQHHNLDQIVDYELKSIT